MATIFVQYGARIIVEMLRAFKALLEDVKDEFKKEMARYRGEIP